MKYVLFLMFFVTPPGSPQPEAKKIWTLQSTAAMEFESEQTCISSGKDIRDSLRATDTLTVRGWCLPKGAPIPPSAAITEPRIIRLPLH